MSSKKQMTSTSCTLNVGKQMTSNLNNFCSLIIWEKLFINQPVFKIMMGLKS
jgi:hypothetical protein